MSSADLPAAAAAFSSIGWIKPVTLFERYLAEQAAGTRSCWVAHLEAVFAGYVTVNWKPTYPFFAEKRIPEIQDLNVLPPFRRKGIGTTLLVQAEAEIVTRSDVAGLGVGLHPGYNDAQRLYVKRGYVPDGQGVTYKDRYVREGEQVRLDDDFLLHMLRRIRP
ncbi:MAG: GNAT family N-acetyltransferase [Silvibacterium sp.]|nr:GNAT family N-acetyltransferase [Silvibacterium sp.]